jgi:uroporphyrinogen decarboxylase
MADTCLNEQYLMTALRREAPEKIPSFCQSIMSQVTHDYMIKYEDDIPSEDVLLTPIGDLTIYKCFGYSSHWAGSPGAKLIVDAVLKEKISEMNHALHKSGQTNLTVNNMGSIRGSNKIANWFVEAGIKTEDQLRFFLDRWQNQPPTIKEIENYREARLLCMDNNFVPFASSHVVMEPANQSITFALTAKLIRKNPALLEQFYDFIVEDALMRFQAAIKAGYKLFCTADDMAYKTGPMLSPEHYLRFVTPRAKRVCQLIHDSGGLVFMHTDGFIDPVMHCFIEAGYDAIQPLEPTSMGYDALERVKRLWGNKIAMIGNCDTTNTLSFKTPTEVRAEVHRDFRMAKGTDHQIKGYVFAASGSLHDRVKLENALAMMDEYKKIRDGIIPI